jgi:hypothetical protein
MGFPFANSYRGEFTEHDSRGTQSQWHFNLKYQIHISGFPEAPDLKLKDKKQYEYPVKRGVGGQDMPKLYKNGPKASC